MVGDLFHNHCYYSTFLPICTAFLKITKDVGIYRHLYFIIFLVVLADFYEFIQFQRVEITGNR